MRSINLLSSDDGINYLNAILMLASTAIAFFIPFHLFLFVYAVLGPLHYLTELSWLEKRNFFVQDKTDIFVFVFICVIIFLSFFVPSLGNFNTAFIATAFVFSVCCIFFSNKIMRYLITLTVFLWLARYYPDNKISEHGNFHLVILFSIFLPTLIHVYVFTGMFLVSGAVKQKKVSGFIAVFMFALCTLSFVFINPNLGSTISSELKLVFEQFKIMNKGLLYILNSAGFEKPIDIWRLPDDAIYNHKAGIACMRFIAFAYCYHYLNWFSKTAVIKWHEVSKKRMWVILLLWIFSVSLYAMNYQTGFYALFVLSMLHVLCEFPLNFHTFSFLGKTMVSPFRGRKT
jgi:hypothetical protein